MALGGKEDRELNLLLEGQDRRVGRRGFLRTAAVLGAAGAAGYAGGTVAGLSATTAAASHRPQCRPRRRCRATAATSGC